MESRTLTTTEITTDRLEELLGDDADEPARAPRARRSRRTCCTCPGPTSSTASTVDSDRNPQVLRNLQCAARPRPPRRHRLRLDPARSTRASSTRPARRSRRTRIYFDPENIVKLAIEGGCNARRLDARRARLGRAQVRPQDPVHRQDQPQRVPLLSERVRPDHVRAASSGRATWARRASARRSTSAPRESRRQIVEVARGVPAGARARHVHRAVVLPAQHRLQGRRRRLPRWPPTSPARPTTSA